MENSKIEWTDHTFNPWRGCTKVSPGCERCYAEALSKRTGHGEYKKGVPRERMSTDYWKQPLKWNKTSICQGCGTVQEVKHCEDGCSKPDPRTGWCEGELRRPRVFCASLSDWLDDEAPIEWLADLLQLIHDTPNLDWLLLTKRPQNWMERLRQCRGGRNSIDCMVVNWFNGHAPANVWIGTTVEDQTRANQRIPELLKIPAKVRFLSCEPLLSGLDLARAYPEEFAVCSHRDCGHYGIGDSIRECVECEGREENPDNGDCAKCDKGTMRDICPKCECSDDSQCYAHPNDYAEEYETLPGIHWVICGSESGPGKRAMNTGWATSLHEQCKAAGVKFFMKQMDVKGRISGEIDQFPINLQVREFPL